MCLDSENLNMIYDEDERDFVGVGYKVIYLIDSMGRINLSKSPIKTKWTEAKGSFFSRKFNKNRISCLDCKNEYWPGFHIFLKIEDAIRYNSTPTLVEVKYKSVTGFGKNDVSTKNCEPCDCVIARYAKITKVMSRFAYYYNYSVRDKFYKEYN